MTSNSKIKTSSNRSFGLVFFVVFLIVALWPLKNAEDNGLWSLFNIWGEPIVNTPEDAFICFMGTEINNLVIENCFLSKEKQNKSLKMDYKGKYELD